MANYTEYCPDKMDSVFIVTFNPQTVRLLITELLAKKALYLRNNMPLDFIVFISVYLVLGLLATFIAAILLPIEDEAVFSSVIITLLWPALVIIIVPALVYELGKSIRKLFTR